MAAQDSDPPGTGEVAGARPTTVPAVGREAVGAEEIGAAEVGAAEMGVAQVGVAQVGVAQVGVAEVGVAEVGVGPWRLEHPDMTPDDERFDPELLAHGDRRNVADRYRYWRLEAIVADLDSRRHEFQVGIENWQHDLNIGSVVRTANAFLAAEVHIVGRRRWNRRGAMVTDRYQHIRRHRGLAELAGHAASAGLTIIGVDNTPGAVPLETYPLPRRSLLLFGQEGPGLTDQAVAQCAEVLSIAQFGSTRSINASAAAAIAMHAWIRRWVSGQQPAQQPAGSPPRHPDPPGVS